MEVGVRELKAHLSEYLRRVATGESVVITDRGIAAAVLGPVPGRALVESGVREGWATAATHRGLTPFWPVASGRHTGDVLDDDRGS